MIRNEPVIKRALIGPLVVLLASLVGYGGFRAYQDRQANEVVEREGGVADVRAAFDAPVGSEVAVSGYVFIDRFTGDLLCSERTSGRRPACEGLTARLEQLDPTRLDLVRADEGEIGFDAWSRDRVVLQVVTRRGTMTVRDVLPVPDDGS